MAARTPKAASVSIRPLLPNAAAKQLTAKDSKKPCTAHSQQGQRFGSKLRRDPGIALQVFRQLTAAILEKGRAYELPGNDPGRKKGTQRQQTQEMRSRRLCSM